MTKTNIMKKYLNLIILTILIVVSQYACVSSTNIKRVDRLKEKAVDQFRLDSIRQVRVKTMQAQPKVVAKFNEKYTDYCLRRAKAEQEKHGRWFYCEDNKEFRESIRWDEVVTYRIYAQLLMHFGELEKIPGYSKENHEEAIKFWQGWQREDGAFCNVFTGKGGGSDQHCNSKYIPSLMGILDCKPLYETTGYGAAVIDQVECLDKMRKGNMNHATAISYSMMNLIQKGELEYIPVFEQSLEIAVSQLSQHSGMFHGYDGNFKGREWSSYTATAQTMKGISSMIAYMGLENIPFRHKRADALIENQEWFRKDKIAVKRNTSEAMIHCLLETPYREDELQKALAGHAEVILEGEPWESHMTGDYASYALQMLGSLLHWEGYEESTPRTPFPMGTQYDYRIEVGPLGRCVNVIKKKPEELITHKDWSIETYGLRARNTAHEKRKVIDIVPATDEEWTKSVDKEGRVILKRTFSLEQIELENPYIKIKWSDADIEILLNGVLVKKKLGGLSDYGAVNIAAKALKSLRPGENTLVLRSVNKADALNASAGLIDWKLQENKHK
jgi:hypothetical protein